MELEETGGLTIRAALDTDLDQVIEIDEANTGLAKPDYWRDSFERFGRRKGRYFLVAEDGGRVLGFVIGEIRAWEFGSPPCGWVFAMGVRPEARLRKVGSHLFDALVNSLKAEGITKMRTMLAVDDDLNMAFFRSQGMMGGPFIQLEKQLD